MKEKPSTKKVKPSTDSDGEDGEDEGQDDSTPQGKRKLTYQIEKNKGTTPYRKKEYRNPRVKHRMKYRKAQISRKGQVKVSFPFFFFFFFGSNYIQFDVVFFIFV